jgi:hypothetical protein
MNSSYSSWARHPADSLKENMKTRRLGRLDNICKDSLEVLCFTEFLALKNILLDILKQWLGSA